MTIQKVADERRQQAKDQHIVDVVQFMQRYSVTLDEITKYMNKDNNGEQAKERKTGRILKGAAN